MADKKITQLTNITGADLANGDEFVVVDITADETKAITFDELKTAFDTGTGFVRVTGDTMTGDLSFGDNDKAIFGTGSDLQIYHDGSNSYIKDVATGNLNIDASNLSLRSWDGAESYIDLVDNSYVQIRHNNAIKLATTSTGIDVTGTVTADGLTVDSGSGNIGIITKSTDQFAFIGFEDNTSSSSSVYVGADGNDFIARANSVTRFRAASNGDISFYEDTGTTAKFFWDASAERLGIGTSSPLDALHIASAVSTDYRGNLLLQDTTTMTAGVGGQLTFGGNYTGSGQITEWSAIQGTKSNSSDDYSGQIEFKTRKQGYALQTKMTLDADGKVGIGTSSPSDILQVNHPSTAKASSIRANATNTDAYFVVGNSDLSDFILLFGGHSNNNASTVGWDDSNDLRFATYQNHTGTFGSEAMRIDSSGKVGIGTSSPSTKLTVLANSANGIDLAQDPDNGTNSGRLFFTTSGGSNSIRSTSGALQFSTGATAGSSSGTERMRIDSSGNVDIKTVGSASAPSLHFGGDSDTGFFKPISNTLAFSTFGSERMRIDASGNVNITNGNLVVASGHGIDFSATGNSSGTTSSELLDDYEEGTWTVTDQSGAGLSLTVYVSTYTKIGNQVFFEIGMVFPTTSNTSPIKLSLPFLVKNSADNTGGAVITTTNSGRTSDSVVALRNDTKLAISSNLNANVLNSNFSGKQLRVAGQYTTSA